MYLKFDLRLPLVKGIFLSSAGIRPFAYDLSLQQWKDWLAHREVKPFVAQQIMEWLFCKEVNSPQMFSNVPIAVRQALQEEFRFELPPVDSVLSSCDGSEKLLWKTPEGFFAECVIMPSENRVTLCVSSQVGCAMACTFCQTGKMGLTRNLTSGEIICQVLLANKRLKETGSGRRVTNVVFMGMGEPLDNYNHLVAACKLMIDPCYFGLSKHRVTVSTSGLVPEIRKLGHELPVALAISLHSADDALRTEMMPINKRYPLAELKEALLEYPIHTRHGITFEYVMIEGKNDSISHAKKLVKFLHGLKAKVNLIPLNAHPGAPMEASSAATLRAFQQYLSIRSIPAPVRYSRGQDVSGACGQLAAKRKEELDFPPRKVALARRREYLDEKAALAQPV